MALGSFLPYPGLEALAEKATPEAIQTQLDEADAAAGARDEAKIISLSQKMSDLGFNWQTYLNGTYNLIDKDGFHCAAHGGMKIVKIYRRQRPEEAAPGSQEQGLRGRVAR